jgi:hypothetical protein
MNGKLPGKEVRVLPHLRQMSKRICGSKQEAQWRMILVQKPLDALGEK